MSFEGRTFTFIKRIVQLLGCFMSGSQAGKVIYGLITVIHLQRIAPTPPIEGTERLPTPKRRRSANKLPYVRVDLAELPRCL